MNALLETYKLPTLKKGVSEGVRICVKCGNPETTILKDVIYCRTCRDFQFFRKNTKRRHYNTGTTLDLD